MLEQASEGDADVTLTGRRRRKGRPTSYDESNVFNFLVSDEEEDFDEVCLVE